MEDVTAETVLIVNPNSGSGDHVEAVERRAAVLGYVVEKTEEAGQAIDLARSAAEAGAAEVVAVGGDGTLNEVVRGVVAADALARVTVGVVPAGTGNDFASNLAIASVDDAFTALEEGERRYLDLGFADDRPFVNSCVAGLTADASGATSPDLKSRFGVLAYVITTARTVGEFQGLELTATVDDGESDAAPVWSGSAEVVLVGNGRRFGPTGIEQANLEDGLLDVTIVEEAPSPQLLEERVRERLLGGDADHVTRILASSLSLDIGGGEPATFSLDGEMVEFESVDCSTRRRSLCMPVGEGYEPTPTDD